MPPSRGARRRGRPIGILLAVVVVASACVTALTSQPAPAATRSPVWVVGMDGAVYAYGGAPYRGGLNGTRPPTTVIGVAARPSGNGYWLVALDGGVRGFGDAPQLGGMRGVHLVRPVVGMAATPSGRGYWLVATDGGIFAFGDARFRGSLGGLRLNQPIAGMVPTHTARGYWMVASDGGIFAFGDARFRGSLGSVGGHAPISTMAATPTGNGYWMLARDGRVFPFGDAHGFGDARGSSALAVGIVPTPTGHGYWIVFVNGAVRSFGDASAFGPVHASTPVVGVATPLAASSGAGLVLVENPLAFTPAPPKTWVGDHEAALTFDDGPASDTSALLGTLVALGAPATFFTVGYEVAARPDLVAAEARAGMSVEDHSWNHPDFTRLAPTDIVTQLNTTADAIQRATGHRPRCFRPPYGSTNATVAAVGAQAGFPQVLWNVDPSDYLRPGAGVIAARVLAAATGRGIVVGMHDGGGNRSQTVAALPTIVAGLRARGYRLVRLCA